MFIVVEMTFKIGFEPLCPCFLSYHLKYFAVRSHRLPPPPLPLPLACLLLLLLLLPGQPNLILTPLNESDCNLSHRDENRGINVVDGFFQFLPIQSRIYKRMPSWLPVPKFDLCLGCLQYKSRRKTG